MARPIVILATFLTATLPSLALAQDKVFRAWFEAPQVVMAGETVQVWMWATYEVDGVPEVDGNMHSVVGSIEVSGDIGAFSNISPLRDGLALILDRGTPDGSWLRDFMTVQPYGVPGVIIDESNPLRILMFEIETTPNTTGHLHLDLRPFTDESIPHLSWFYPFADPFYWVITTDSDVSLITTTATIRVIPAPSSYLSLVILVAWRRRREARS